MNMYVFSPSKNLIYPVELKGKYISAGTWPDDEVEISDEMANEFITQSPPGKIRIVVNDLPAWEDIPPPQKEELIAQADACKQNLINSAMQSIDVIQLKIKTGRVLTDIETDRVNAVLDYIDEVTTTDTSTAPDIDWPPLP